MKAVRNMLLEAKGLRSASAAFEVWSQVLRDALVSSPLQCIDGWNFSCGEDKPKLQRLGAEGDEEEGDGGDGVQDSERVGLRNTY